jgi:hypothetical protein
MSNEPALRSWTCAVCGETHDDLPAATLSAPDAWFRATDEEQAAEFELTSDTCVWRDEHFFVRCVLRLPLLDREGTFDFGVWSTLSRDSFSRYMELFESPKRTELGPMFGWFSNSLPGYPETLNLECHVFPNVPDLRPSIELAPTDHPLAVQQQQGIVFTDAVAYLHEHLAL